MATLAQLKASYRLIIAQEDPLNSDTDDDDVKAYLNQSVRKYNLILGWPFKITDVSLTQGVGAYDFPTDAVRITGVNYGDPTQKNGIGPLNIFNSLEEFEVIYPGWQSTDVAAQGIPVSFCPLSESQYLIHPRPNADSITSPKVLKLRYVYYAADLSSDSDEPVLPIAYHDLLPYEAAVMAYAGPLKNLDVAKKLSAYIKDTRGEIESKIRNRSTDMGFFFDTEDAAVFNDSISLVAFGRLGGG